jgi:hypothetical protein
MRFVTRLFVSSSPHLNAPPPQNQESFLAIAEIKLWTLSDRSAESNDNVAVAVVALSPMCSTSTGPGAGLPLWFQEDGSKTEGFCHFR